MDHQPVQKETLMYHVEKAEEGLRFNRWFSRRYPHISYNHREKLLRKGEIRIDGRRIKSSERLMDGQQIRIPPFLYTVEEHKTVAPSPYQQAGDRAFLESIKLYEDDDIIAFNKPAGLPTQGGTKAYRHMDGLLASLESQYGMRPKLVHRLDKDTSGVLVVAKTTQAAAWVTSAFYHRSTKKRYWALVVGLPPQSEGIIQLPLAKMPGRYGEKVMADLEGGREAITEYTIIETVSDRLAWVELRPLTGRTHQLRAHCAYMGTPILGDGKYGGATAYPFEGAPLMHLHAASLTLPRSTGGTLTVTAPLPPHMKGTWDMLGFTVPLI